jgi:hypothetical protein
VARESGGFESRQYKYIEWLEQYAPKAGEFNLAWDAYEAQMEEEE